MFYELVYKMAFEMGFMVIAMWIAMMVLDKRQTTFRGMVISGLLLFGIASYLDMQDFATALQLASLCLLALGWFCKLRWQIKRNRSEMDS